MKLLKQSALTALLAAGISTLCTAQSAQEINNYADRILETRKEAVKAKQTDASAALAVLEQMLETSAPTPDFESEDTRTVMISFSLCDQIAAMYLEAAYAADDSGQWEKALDYFRKSAESIREPAAKTKEAYQRFCEGYEAGKKPWLDLMNTHAEEIRILKAKSESDYTNDDYTALENIMIWEEQIAKLDEFIQYFNREGEKVDSKLAAYGDSSRETHQLEKIKSIDDQIASYIYQGRRGDKVHWVEGVVASVVTPRSYIKDMSLDSQIAFTHRLIHLSPNSKTAPVLLQYLKGNATEAELKRALQAARPPAKKK